MVNRDKPSDIKVSNSAESTNHENPLLHLSNCPYPKLKRFKIGHLNITSLYKHIEELRILLRRQPFDIICVNETRLDRIIRDEEVEITSYEIVRLDRNRNGRALQFI